MNRRSFFGSLCGTALLAFAAGTGLGETGFAVSKGGRSPSVLMRSPETGEWIRRWCTWNEFGHPRWHEVTVGEPGIDAPYLTDFL